MTQRNIYQVLTLPVLCAVLVIGSSIEADPLWGGLATLGAVLVLGWVVWKSNQGGEINVIPHYPNYPPER